MKIRSITCFIQPSYPVQAEAIQRSGQFIAQARPALEAAGFQVQTARLATTPFPDLLSAITALLLDLAVLSERLKKPLSATKLQSFLARDESFSLVPHA